MPEFTCICRGPGRIIYLVGMKNRDQGSFAKLELYGCLYCHRIYFDTPTYPLTQKHIDRGT